MMNERTGGTMSSDYGRRRMAEILVAAHEMAQKKHDDPAEQMMHELMHAAIGLAGEHGRERSTIAARLGIAKDTLDTRLGSKHDKALRAADLARLIFDPSVLGDESHVWLMEQLAIKGGRGLLMPIYTVKGNDLVREALEVADAGGFLSATILQVTDEASDGGKFVTATEHRKIDAAVGGVISECGDLMSVPTMGVQL